MEKTMFMKPLPSREELLENFSYDPETGDLVRIKFGRGQRRSKPRGSWDSTCLGRQRYKKHRIIWKIMTGEDPADTVDHHDGDELNNRWVNLRIATHHGQMRNSKQHPGKTGVFGVSYMPNCAKPWRARIKVNGEYFYLGGYMTLEEATKVRREAEQKYHGEFALSNRPK